MNYRHLEQLKISATFSDCGKFRYRLRISDPESNQGKLLCVIMQNPSEADEIRADKSVQFLENLVFIHNYPEFKGVTELVIVNQFAYIQKKGFTGSKEAIGAENDSYIRNSIHRADIVLIAWGKNNSFLDRQEFILKMIQSEGNKLLFKTKKHPSRGRYKDFIEPLEISLYNSD